MKKNYLTILLFFTIFNMETLLAKESKDLNNTKEEIKIDKILAIVNGEKIYESSFAKQFDKFKLSRKEEMLEKVISSELLVQFAEKHSLYKDKILIEETNKHAKNVKAKDGKFSDLDYRMVLGLNVIESLAKSYALKEANTENIHTYYKKRYKNFEGMPYVDAYSIKSTTKEKAENIIKELNLNKSKNKKEIFLKLTKKYQVDNKGYLGKVYKFGIENNIFNRALFSLGTNKYSLSPLKIKDSFYVLYVALQSTASKAPSEKELKSNIKYIIQYKSKNQWINSKLEELRGKSKIINNLKPTPSQ